MAQQGRPWAVVITIAVTALVAAGALAGAAALRHRDVSSDTTTTDTTTATGGVGVEGCLRKPCTVPVAVPVGASRAELVVDNGGMSGRLRIGGGGASKVVEATITSMGAKLGADSLQCVDGTLSACLLRGATSEGVVGQVVAGRSGQWGELPQPFVSDAGFLALSSVTNDVGPEILVAQHRCQRGAQDCATTPVYVRVYTLQSQELGCTKDYRQLDALPGWPTVKLERGDLTDCA